LLPGAGATDGYADHHADDRAVSHVDGRTNQHRDTGHGYLDAHGPCSVANPDPPRSAPDADAAERVLGARLRRVSKQVLNIR